MMLRCMPMADASAAVAAGLHSLCATCCTSLAHVVPLPAFSLAVRLACSCLSPSISPLYLSSLHSNAHVSLDTRVFAPDVRVCVAMASRLNMRHVARPSHTHATPLASASAP